MMLHAHKDGTDALTLVDVANDFVGEVNVDQTTAHVRLTSIGVYHRGVNNLLLR